MQRHENTPETDLAPEQMADTVVRLPTVLDLVAADGLHAQLAGRIGQDRALIVDGGDVERAATASIQILLAAAIATRANHQAFRLIQGSAVLSGAIRDLGLTAAFGMEEV